MPPPISSAAPNSCGASPTDFVVYSGDDAHGARADAARRRRRDLGHRQRRAPAHARDVRGARLPATSPRAREINNKLLGLHRHLFCEANPIPVKWAVQQLGRIPGGIRLPLTPLANGYHNQVREAMRQAESRMTGQAIRSFMRTFLLYDRLRCWRASRSPHAAASSCRPRKSNTSRRRKLPPLDVPPDLTRPSADDRFVVPESRGGAATFSAYQKDRGGRAEAGGAAPCCRRRTTRASSAPARSAGWS